MCLIIPDNYIPLLNQIETLKAVELITDIFNEKLSKSLNLQKVNAPLFYQAQSGLSENYNGKFPSVTFAYKNEGNEKYEIFRAITKWKRQFLADLQFKTGSGIYAEITGIRPDEELSNIHSTQVDQWDWELVISGEQYQLDFLKSTVEKIYMIFVELERIVVKMYPSINPVLPENVTFLYAENLAKDFPQLTPFERECKVAEKYGAAFIIGIGGPLSTGEVHGQRNADSDDWITENGSGLKGLNGDLIFWNPVLKQSLEISSMGIRVDKPAFLKQVDILNCKEITKFPWQQKLLNNELPLTIGGGIGISRTYMYFLRKAHIGEVRPAVWPLEMVNKCKANNINLL